MQNAPDDVEMVVLIYICRIGRCDGTGPAARFARAARFAGNRYSLVRNGITMSQIRISYLSILLLALAAGAGSGLEQFSFEHLSDHGKVIVHGKLSEGARDGLPYLEVGGRVLQLDTADLVLYHCDYRLRRCRPNGTNKCDLALWYIVKTSLDTLDDNGDADIVVVRVCPLDDKDSAKVSAGTMQNISCPKCYLTPWEK